MSNLDDLPTLEQDDQLAEPLRRVAYEAGMMLGLSATRDEQAYHRRRLLPRFVEKGEKKPLRLCGTSSSCTKAFLLFPFFLSPPPRGVPSLPPQARAGSVSSSPEVVTAVAKGGRCKGRKETSCLRSVPPSFTVFSSTSCPLVLVRLFQP